MGKTFTALVSGSSEWQSMKMGSVEQQAMVRLSLNCDYIIPQGGLFSEVIDTTISQLSRRASESAKYLAENRDNLSVRVDSVV